MKPITVATVRMPSMKPITVATIEKLPTPRIPTVHTYLTPKTMTMPSIRQTLPTTERIPITYRPAPQHPTAQGSGLPLPLVVLAALIGAGVSLVHVRNRRCDKDGEH